MRPREARVRRMLVELKPTPRVRKRTVFFFKQPRLAKWPGVERIAQRYVLLYFCKCANVCEIISMDSLSFCNRVDMQQAAILLQAAVSIEDAAATPGPDGLRPAFPPQSRAGSCAAAHREQRRRRRDCRERGAVWPGQRALLKEHWVDGLTSGGIAVTEGPDSLRFSDPGRLNGEEENCFAAARKDEISEMEQPSVHLWVKHETFIVGVLQITPPSKFSMHYLRKMATYVRTKGGDGGYPRLTWPMWRHIACGKLQLAEYLAWLYFETFDGLLERSSEERLEWAEAVSHCRSEEEVDKLKSKLSVDTLQFLLFLYVQQLNKVSLRTSLIGEEWPSPRSRSPDLDGKSNSQNKNMDDHNHLAFVLNRLSELLELLLDPEQLTASNNTTHDSMISVEAVKAMNFLIEGSVGQNEVVYPVHELALWQPVLATSGYSRLSKMFCFRKLQSWLRSVLGPNPFGTAVCFRKGKKLAWAQQVEGTTKRAKIACNIYTAPKGHKVVVMTQVYKQTLAKSSDQLVGAHVKIHRCNDCYIYLLSPLRSVSIENCRNTTFVLGPVQTTIHIHSCDDVKVIAICHRLSVSSSSSCTFHCLTPTNPLIMSGNMSLTFAPYHTYYPMLEDHMARTGIATIPNYWNKPLCIGVDNNEMPVYQLLSPKEFHPFVIPFEIEGDTMEIPGGLPPQYEKAVRQREQKIQNWQKTIKEAGLSKEQRKLFQNLVEQEFCEWLDQTGHRQQLDSLIPAPASSKQTTC
ncbi:hypothetical protein chiPu_0005980 [Chiloscyllium punctatum]|uniref:TBCC domain-containing protein 1 n=2 Tax=Chiloscyllium punctatum TaxID=137246 RepID=A0A401SAX1_CHIPU|nr:hypothetical protein [Chiloscyllium punctatum]